MLNIKIYQKFYSKKYIMENDTVEKKVKYNYHFVHNKAKSKN